VPWHHKVEHYSHNPKIGGSNPAASIKRELVKKAYFVSFLYIFASVCFGKKFHNIDARGSSNLYFLALASKMNSAIQTCQQLQAYILELSSLLKSI
jgi:hypothetical protein